ncbi:LacI family DNA-binding transcriptional regulator [Devosia sp. YIM 151766]|uniref:LacI family DNA-binding transcriptional regulator n=1 Tax=Devosia sp. YIM 151766 TaxID=3017325 RepID=UPI00255C9499|nr:LacI family DNA-binding transcriptional regulator [Devosia sp. YIM 151766]WIY53565.1 LacI family DNA-binding transcriptional regulator [Devosia sp. YIM 151766]
MKKRVKMVDIAKAANVSRTAVSLILNGVAGVRIAEATRQRVLTVARELGYKPGPSLRDLGPDEPRLFGVLINEISSAYPIDLLYGLQSWADAQGVQILIQVSDGASDHEMAALDNFDRFGVSGVIYASTFSTIASPPQALSHFRHILLNCRREDRSGTAVLPAERHGGALAAQHLIDSGRRRIATITGDPWQFASRERLAGYHRALNKAGLNLGEAYEETSDWGHASGYAAARRLLDLPAPPDAIFCHNDIVARGAIAAAREAGLTIGDDLAIIGYDDREFAKDLGITSITLPFAEMAERAMSEIAGTGRLADRTLSITGKLIPRASTAPGLSA